METGISIFVLKVAIDQLQHTLPAAPEGHRDRLPLAVSLLMTAWGKDASVGHDLLGWAMRVIADNPILTSASLNAAVSGAFADHETVELIPIDLSSDAIVRLWQVLPNSLQLSVCYVARTLHVESEAVRPEGCPARWSPAPGGRERGLTSGARSVRPRRLPQGSRQPGPPTPATAQTWWESSSQSKASLCCEQAARESPGSRDWQFPPEQASGRPGPCRGCPRLPQAEMQVKVGDLLRCSGLPLADV